MQGWYLFEVPASQRDLFESWGCRHMADGRSVTAAHL
jgi:hypothetical protein